MSARSVLTWFVVSMMILSVTCDNTVIYVKPDEPLNTSQPCPDPCISLFINASQLSDLLTSNTILKLQLGVHFIGQDIVVWNKTNISFIGDVQGTEDVVHITCSESASISFVNCSNVIVKDVILKHCGNFLDTSYMDTAIGENYWYKFPSVPRAALIFLHCFSTILDNLFITESPGFGVLGVNMLGNTRLQSINIEFLGSFPCSTFYASDVPFAGGILLLYQNTPNDSPNISTFTLSDSAFLSSCCPVSLDNATDLVGSGGISAIFGHNLYSLNMIIENSIFVNSTAYYHPGLNFIYYTGVSGTNVSINNCTFADNVIDNTSHSLQGIVAINYATPIKSFYLRPGRSFQQLPSNLHEPNEVSITDCVFMNNTSYESSGISFLSSGEDPMMKIYLKNTHFTRNVGYISSAIIILQQQSTVFSNAFQVTIDNCTFFNNSLSIPEELYVNDQVNLFRYASVIVLHNIKLTSFKGSVLFKNNEGSSIFLYNSIVSFNGSFRFVENYAIVGAGLGVYSNSYILMYEGTNISFIDNVARRRGGAIYVEDLYSVPGVLANVCFFQYLSSQGNLDEIGNIDINVTFANNSAGEAGNSIFSSSIDECSWMPNTAFQKTSPLTVLNRVIFFAIPSRQEISSIPYQVCFCSLTTTQDIETACRNNSYSTIIYPGETIDVTVIGTGQYYGPAPSIIYTTVSGKSNCSVDGLKHVVHEIPNSCTTLQYVVSSNISGNCILHFRTDTQPTIKENILREAVVKMLDCPYGFALNDDGVCDCHPLLISPDNPAMVTDCNLTSQTFRRQGHTWLHTVNSNGTLTEVIARSYCYFGYCKNTESDLSLSDLDSQCSHKRSGTLCGQCQSGYSSVFGSTQCKVCSNDWLFLLIVFAIAGIILVVVIFVLNFTITSGTINGIIFYANVISINETILFPTSNTFRPLLAFISFLNLDLGIETCFYDGMDEYAKIWLEYVFPVYLIMKVGVIIVMARYTTWAQRVVQRNGVPVLSTLLFLSYTKLLRNSSVILFYNVGITYLPSGRIEQVWAVDANVEYFGFKFTILFVVSLLMFLLILIPFTLVMLFTKTFLRFKHVAHFKPMLDAYQSSFANPFRFWLGLRLLIRAFLFSTSAMDTQTILLINSITLCGLAIMQGYFRPFNSFYCNLWDLSFLLNLATLFIVSLYFGEANDIMVTVLVGISFVQFSALMCYHVIKAFGQHRINCMTNLKAFRKISVLLQRTNTLLVNSSIYKHLAVIPQEPVRHKTTQRNNEQMEYSEMREPLVTIDDDDIAI